MPSFPLPSFFSLSNKKSGRSSPRGIKQKVIYALYRKARVIVAPHLVLKAPIEKKGHKARQKHEYKMRSEQQIDS